MGFNNANIVKEEDEYVWRGDKNLHIYESEFEKYLILKVSIFFLNPITAHRNILSKKNLLTKPIISNIL